MRGASQLQTQCKIEKLEFQAEGVRKIEVDFNGGDITSDGGILLLSQTEESSKIISQLAECFIDHRNQNYIEHTKEELLKQRIYGLALGYEDLNDHDQLRYDPAIAAAIGKSDPTGKARRRNSDQGKGLAGKSTLNRLELSANNEKSPDKEKQFTVDNEIIRELFVNLYIQSHSAPPSEIVLDIDATDDPLHGKQEGRYFHGYYGNYCYLPLYIFCGDQLLSAELRTSDKDAAVGALEDLKRIIPQIRQSWPHTKITIRADGGFCREEIFVWCEANDVKYVIGMSKNDRLKKFLQPQMEQAKQAYEATSEPSRVFGEFYYKTKNSWSLQRRVIGKAEHLEKGANPRFIVTNLSRDEYEAKQLYEQLYCARGEMENRIKEQQLELFADRLSTSKLKSNQLRLWFSSIAYVMMETLRRSALNETEMSQAQCSTIRLKLLKIGAIVKVSVRRVYIGFASGYPFQSLFIKVYKRLSSLQPCQT